MSSLWLGYMPFATWWKANVWDKKLHRVVSSTLCEFPEALIDIIGAYLAVPLEGRRVRSSRRTSVEYIQSVCECNGHLVTTQWSSNQVFLWDSEFHLCGSIDLKILNPARPQPGVRSLCHMNDTTVAAGLMDGSVRFIDVQGASMRERTESLQCSDYHGGGAVFTMVRVRDGRLISGMDNGEVYVWSRDMHTEEGDAESKAQWQRQIILKEHTSTVCCLLELGENVLASGSWDKNIKMWYIGSDQPEEVMTLRGHESWVVSLVSLYDGRMASGSLDRTIRLWRVDNGQCLRMIDTEAPVWSLAYYGASRLYSAHNDCVIGVWNAERGVCVKKMLSKIDRVQTLAVGSGGGLLMGGNTRRLRDEDTGIDSSPVRRKPYDPDAPASPRVKDEESSQMKEWEARLEVWE